MKGAARWRPSTNDHRIQAGELPRRSGWRRLRGRERLWPSHPPRAGCHGGLRLSERAPRCCQPKLHGALTGGGLAGRMTQAKNPFRYFDSSPEVIRLVVMMYVRYPLSLRNVEDLLFERGIDICHETVRVWWNRFCPMFAGEIRKRRVARMRGYPQWRWHLDEVFVKVNGHLCYLWRAVDHEGEAFEAVVTASPDKPAA